MNTVLLLALVAAAVPSTTALTCSTREWGKCNGPNNEILCCPLGFYYQPWFPPFSQCVKQPTIISPSYDECLVTETNYDYPGNDVAEFFGLTPDECCSRSLNRTDCGAYTFVNDHPNRVPGGCFLKSYGDWKKTYLKGAISAQKVDMLIKATDKP